MRGDASTWRPGGGPPAPAQLPSVPGWREPWLGRPSQILPRGRGPLSQSSSFPSDFLPQKRRRATNHSTSPSRLHSRKWGAPFPGAPAPGPRTPGWAGDSEAEEQGLAGWLPRGSALAAPRPLPCVTRTGTGSQAAKCWVRSQSSLCLPGMGWREDRRWRGGGPWGFTQTGPETGWCTGWRRLGPRPSTTGCDRGGGPAGRPGAVAPVQPPSAGSATHSQSFRPDGARTSMLRREAARPSSAHRGKPATRASCPARPSSVCPAVRGSPGPSGLK